MMILMPLLPSFVLQRSPATCRLCRKVVQIHVAYQPSFPYYTPPVCSSRDKPSNKIQPSSTSAASVPSNPPATPLPPPRPTVFLPPSPSSTIDLLSSSPPARPTSADDEDDTILSSTPEEKPLLPSLESTAASESFPNEFPSCLACAGQSPSPALFTFARTHSALIASRGGSGGCTEWQTLVSAVKTKTNAGTLRRARGQPFINASTSWAGFEMEEDLRQSEEGGGGKDEDVTRTKLVNARVLAEVRAMGFTERAIQEAERMQKEARAEKGKG